MDLSFSFPLCKIICPLQGCCESKKSHSKLLTSTYKELLVFIVDPLDVEAGIMEGLALNSTNTALSPLSTEAQGKDASTTAWQLSGVKHMGQICASCARGPVGFSRRMSLSLVPSRTHNTGQGQSHSPPFRRQRCFFSCKWVEAGEVAGEREISLYTCFLFVFENFPAVEGYEGRLSVCNFPSDIPTERLSGPSQPVP